MSVKSVFKKKLLKIKNPINSMKKKSKKNKFVISAPSEEMNIKSNHLDKVKDKTTITEISLKHEHLHETNIVQKKITETVKIGNKRKSIDNKTNDEQPKKKKVTFSADVKSEKDQKCTAGNMKPLSLNKRKKKNYIKKLKAKKNKQKNAKKCEENASAISTPRQERAIEYLMQWKNDRSNWKFKKIYQLWLIKNTYDSTKISKEQFEILVEYIQTIEGKSRNVILQHANTIVSASSELQELNSSQTNKYHRARTIIQMFG